MKLDDIAKLIEGAASVEKWEAVVDSDALHQFATGPWYDVQHKDALELATRDACFIVASRILLPKLLRVAEAAKAWVTNDHQSPEELRLVAALEADGE
jgi:hypothetical protein